VSAFIWANLNHKAQLLGVAWIAVGLLLYWLMRGTRAGSDELLNLDDAL
jgi:hypothetical protein